MNAGQVSFDSSATPIASSVVPEELFIMMGSSHDGLFAGRHVLVSKASKPPAHLGSSYLRLRLARLCCAMFLQTYERLY